MMGFYSQVTKSAGFGLCIEDLRIWTFSTKARGSFRQLSSSRFIQSICVDRQKLQNQFVRDP